jgi:endonuclease VIII
VPEGQVSHRNAIRLTAALAGRELLRVEAPEPRLAGQRIPERLAGDRVTTVEAAGKHHLIRFASGRTLHSHLMMNGVWRVLQAGRALRPAGLWLALWTADHVAAQYRGPVLRLLEPGETPGAVARLGPDLLDQDVDPAAAAARGLARLPADTEVGEALLDQRVVAGIGNVYKCETCFLCGVDPWRPVGSLSEAESAELGATAAHLMAQGVGEWDIRTYRPPGGRPFSREKTWVYGRRGRPCRRCGTPIRARGQGDANRITYWCPVCQR